MHILPLSKILLYVNSRYHFEGNYVRNPHVSPNRTYNIFGVLNYEIEYYTSNKVGHIASNCRSRITGSSNQSKENNKAPEQQISWKRKQEGSQIEECGIYLTT